MSLPSVSPELLRAGDNRFLSRYVPMLGISLSEMDYLRGWRDDFLGDVIADQYADETAGVGSAGALQNDFHGGAYRLTAGAAIGAYRRLWLGNAADGFSTLDADIGWVMIVRMTLSATTNIHALFGGESQVGGANNIFAGMMSDVVANNWMLRTRTAGGVATNVDTGVAADTNPHWHVLNVYPITGGLRQVDYFLDGAQIGTTTTVVSIVPLTSFVMCYAVAAASRYVDLDFEAVIPRNLA